jgi:hypothetical protein
MCGQGVLRRRGMFLSGQDHNAPTIPHEGRALEGLKAKIVQGSENRYIETGLKVRHGYNVPALFEHSARAAFQTHHGLQQQLNEPLGCKSARQTKMTASRPFCGLRLPDFPCIVSGALERGHGTLPRDF